MWKVVGQHLFSQHNPLAISRLEPDGKFGVIGARVSSETNQEGSRGEWRRRDNGQDWSPHMSFILKGSQNVQPFSWRVGSNPRRRSKNMVHVCSTMWKLENRPSNSISCRDNALRLLILVMDRFYRGLQGDVFISQLGVAFWRVVLREVYFERPNHIWRALKTSILEHWGESRKGKSKGKPSQAKSKAKQMMNREQGTRVRWKSRATLESRAVSRGRARGAGPASGAHMRGSALPSSLPLWCSLLLSPLLYLRS